MGALWGGSPRLLALTRPGIAFSHRAFRRAKIPEISQSPSLPSLGSRDLPLTSFTSMHITFSVPAGTWGCFLPSWCSDPCLLGAAADGHRALTVPPSSLLMSHWWLGDLETQAHLKAAVPTARDSGGDSPAPPGKLRTHYSRVPRHVLKPSTPARLEKCCRAEELALIKPNPPRESPRCVVYGHAVSQTGWRVLGSPWPRDPSDFPVLPPRAVTSDLSSSLPASRKRRKRKRIMMLFPSPSAPLTDLPPACFSRGFPGAD